ncbi:Glutamate 5-kinase [Candidatus Tiddalikarchaeum anstoanum]|nr:Glutamate 5-kinase [Candidatus Tiddalikarchaeum anstoanum]
MVAFLSDNKSYLTDLLDNYSGKKFIIKIGTESVNNINIARLCDVTKYVNERGGRTIIVTSGAKAAGETSLIKHGIDIEKEASEEIIRKQLCCAVGQPSLISKYSVMLEEFGYVVSQYLLPSNLSYLPALKFNLKFKNIIPVLNFNDPLENLELENVKLLSDNDRLAATVGAVINCDLLILLTSVGGLFEHYNEKNQTLVNMIHYMDAKLLVTDSKTNNGTGGMASKIEACEIFKKDVLITSPENLLDVLKFNSDKYTILRYKK